MPINSPSVMRLMGERPRLHSISLIEPEAWHRKHRSRIILLTDGGDHLPSSYIN